MTTPLTEDQIRARIRYKQSEAEFYEQHGETTMAQWARAEAEKWVARLLEVKEREPKAEVMQWIN